MKPTKEHLKSLERLALSSEKKGNLPNGALLLDPNGKVVAESESLPITNLNPTAHSERLLIEKFCKENKSHTMHDYKILTITEPCLMCLSAAQWAELSEIYFIVAAKKYWDKIPWFSECKDIDYAKMAKKFKNIKVYKELPKYSKPFEKILDGYIDNVVSKILNK